MHESRERISDRPSSSSASSPAIALRGGAVRVAVLADVRLYRDALVNALSRRPEVVVIGAARADREGVVMLRPLAPDVVLVEASATYTTTLVKDLERAVPEARVVAYGVAQEERESIQCAEAGVAAFVPQNASVEELVATAVSASRGEFACNPRIAALLLRRISDLAAGHEQSRADAALTPRERQIAGLIDDGLSNKEIAGRLGIGLSTVKNHVHHVLHKLHARKRLQAAAALRRARI